jgi:hypothetical protein
MSQQHAMIKGSRRIGVPSCAEVGRQRRIDQRFGASRNVTERPGRALASPDHAGYSSGPQ